MEKVSDLLQGEIAELLQRRVKHPVLADAMISITHVEVAADLATARVHISLIGDEEETEPVLAALAQTEPYFHRELVKRLHIKRVPRLRFFYDPSIVEADRLSTLMRDVARSEGREL
jgi:ribosome-binding factor A